MQRLAIYFDGTWNDEGDKTNVHRLWQLAADGDANGATQQSQYFEGVGNEIGHKLAGGALGEGLSSNVLKGYQWLRERYNWDTGNDGNHIFIFGFSRGAYTARSLGGLIATCGLAKDPALSNDWLYDRYRNRKDRAEPIWKLQYIKQTGERLLTEDEQHLLDHSARVEIHMIGVWDTVGALGVPWSGMPVLGKKNFYFHNPNLSKIYRHAYHAMAIDEHRAPYKPTLWTQYAPESAKTEPAAIPLEACEQRWFVGAHSDVGGGYKNPLPDAPGRWLQEKAQGLGLAFKSLLPVDPAASVKTKPTDSYGQFMFGIYRMLKFGKRFFRPIGTRTNKVKGGWSYPVNEMIDGSVFDHCRANPDYLPRNLVEWQQKKGVAPLSGLTGVQIARL